MIAVDTNMLVYAHRMDSEWHTSAHVLLQTLCEGHGTWAIPWPCVHEFIAIATHPGIYSPPSTLDQALAQVDAWLGSPSVTVIGEGPHHWDSLAELARVGAIRGPKIHDARIAAICLDAGVSEFLTLDRDFSRFPALRTRNPFADSG